MTGPKSSAESPIPHQRLGPKRLVLGLLAVGAVLAATGWFWQNGRHGGAPRLHVSRESTFVPKITKTDAEWRAQLTPEQYQVTRRKGTEPPFSGAYWNHKEPGQYKCIACGAELFTSETKYDSGCGWPSFFDADHAENLHTEEDRSHSMIRTEVMCSNCGAHLGHLFDDGPNPTGQRYCLNSAALDFEATDAADRPKQPGE